MTIAQFSTEASEYAVKVDHLFYLLSIISGVIVLLVSGAIVVFFALYYRGSRMPRGTVPERKSREIEIGWTVATLFTFLFIFWWAASEQLVAVTPPKQALEIHVVAKQWMWRFQHPSGAREIDELHVPAFTNVRLAMTSQDVIHDLYLPALRLKQDVLPDRYTYEWFNADKTGIFHFTCAEFCGTDHSVMAGTLVIMTPQEYARWTAAQPQGDDLAHQGAGLFRSLGCSGCHTPGSSVHAPDLHGVYGHVVHLSDGSTRIADEAYLRDCMLLPDTTRVAGYPPLMPNLTGAVSEGEIVEIIAYIKSLTSAQDDATTRNPPAAAPNSRSRGVQ
jgi:cytochrome c oxidase subunit II